MSLPRSRGVIVTALLSLVLLATACTDAETTDGGAEPGPSTTVSAGTTETATLTDISPGVEPIIDGTPLPVDPDVRIGALDNGLTYYLRRNDAPGGSLAVRLVVDAGSLQQAEPTDQIAHFTEHMLFNGTERFPGNSLDSTLRNLGAQIGPDLNAYTGFDETVYFLNIGLEERNAETAFTVLAEWAGRATIDADEVVAERGVVREEFRLRREQAGAAVNDAFDRVYYDGTPYEDRTPSGAEQLIMSTDESDIRAFYDRWYRPDLMAVVAVGDLPLDDLEDYVSTFFGDVGRRGGVHPPRIEPQVAIDIPQQVEVVADPSLDGTFISVDYRTPARDPGTFGGEQLDLWDSLITTVISNRVDEAISSGQSSLVRGSGGPFAAARQMSLIGFNLDGPDLGAGTAEFLSLIATLARDGFTEIELERARNQVRAGLDQERAQVDTRQDSEWADLYTAHFLGGADASAPQVRSERVSALIDNTDTVDLNGYFRWLMETTEPLVIVVGPDPDGLPSQSELDALVTNAVAVEQDGRNVAAISELMTRPDPAEVVFERRLDATGGLEWGFANGARVLFLESQIATGVVDLTGYSEGGWSLLAPEDQPLLEVATTMVALSGLADLDKVAMDRYLADKAVDVNPFTFETGEGISGQASSEDLEIAFQLLNLFLSGPRVDQSAFNRVIVQETEELRAVQNRPEVAADGALVALLNGENPARVPLLDRATLDSLTPETAEALYRARMVGVDDLVVAIVGDVDVATVEDLAARYIGTVGTKADDTWVDLLGDPPESVVTVEQFAGPVGGAGVLSLLFTKPGAATDDDRVDGEILQAVIEERLFNRIREELGASYNGGSASVSFLTEPDERSQVYVSVAGDPDRLGEIRSTLLREFNNLDTTGPSEEEFARAKAIVSENYKFVSNGELIAQLFEEATEDGPVLTNAAAAEILDRAGRARVAQLADRVIDTDHWLEVFVTPGR